jgi:hypothetical protein
MARNNTRRIQKKSQLEKRPKSKTGFAFRPLFGRFSSAQNEQKKAPTPENPPCTECGTQKGPYKLKPNHKEPEVISRLTMATMA